MENTGAEGPAFEDITDADKKAQVIKKGRAAVSGLQSVLMGKLTSVMAQKGDVAAVKYCRSQAQDLTDNFQGLSITVGRSSLKIRNPLNAPEPWVAELLMDYQNSSAQNSKQPRAVKISEERYGFVQPIYMQNMCLKCHGSNMSKGILRELDANYLQDQARGYQEGDFRGLFWVSIEGL